MHQNQCTCKHDGAAKSLHIPSWPVDLSPMCRSHLAVSDEDPDLGSIFSTERLTAGDQGLRSLPASVHGAPETLQVLYWTLTLH